METTYKKIYIDPSYKAYYENKLFDENDLILNRDDTLEPYIRMLKSNIQYGITVNTADYLLNKQISKVKVDYYSFGILENYQNLIKRGDVQLKAFVIFEPPVVAPQLYKELPKLTNAFETVYVHNIEGDGYSLRNVNKNKLRSIYWPQPRSDVIEALWERRNRKSNIVVINGSHRPKSFKKELYSKRIEAMIELSKHCSVDLFGRGWNKWYSRNSMWIPYWRNRNALMSLYKGECNSKYEVLSHYNFSLCFENMEMRGYITEKIFDCFYAGTIPIYLGATDIENFISDECYIDYRKFNTNKDLFNFISTMSANKMQKMRDAGRDYLKTEAYGNYYNSLKNIIKR
jgi:alpha(1,3/1,4) fucosyltransferase